MSLFSKRAIIELTNKVVHNLTKNHPVVQEEVGDVMGGQVLKLSVIEAFHEGERKGEAKGQTTLVNAIQDLRSGMTKEELLKKYGEHTVELAYAVK